MRIPCTTALFCQLLALLGAWRTEIDLVHDEVVRVPFHILSVRVVVVYNPGDDDGLIPSEEVLGDEFGTCTEGREVDAHQPLVTRVLPLVLIPQETETANGSLSVARESRSGR